MFGTEPDESAGRWRMLLFPGIWLVYLLQTAGGVADHSSGAVAAVGYAGILVFAAAYLLAIDAARRDRVRYWRWFGLMIAVALLEIPIAREDAFVMCVFIAVLIMAGFAFAGHGRGAILAIAAMTAFATFLPAVIPAWDAEPDWAMLLTLPLVSLAMFGFFTILKANRELSEARAEVARLAAENERSRIARDLHDLLGHSLTTITVKAGLARRLGERGDNDRSLSEIREVETLSRRTLADVRAAVAGHREVTLAGELATAREVLRAAGIIAELPGSVDVVDPRLSETFGWVVREGITNVVRHSRATHCTITLAPRSIEIVDDGHTGVNPSVGNGLAGLGERLAAVGGTIEAGGFLRGWRLRADVPDVPATGVDLVTPTPATTSS